MKFRRAFLLCCLLAASARAQPVRSPWVAGDTIPPDVEVLYRSGLAFLARTQLEDGTWPDHYGNQPGVVGIAVLAFLAHGEDPNHGPYREVIRRGILAILAQQDPQTGYIGNSMYNHGFATLALAEAYGSLLEPDLGPALRRAVDLILRSQQQNKEKAWRYSPTATDADATVTGSIMVALFAARNAGLEVPDQAIQNGLAFFSKCMGPDGGVGYTSAGSPNSTRTAIASLAYSLHRDRTSDPSRRAFQYLRGNLGGGAGSGYVHYHFYYVAQALFQGDMNLWRPWNREMVELFKASQQPDGSWGSQQGGTFGTGASLLTMALNYRLMPIYER